MPPRGIGPASHHPGQFSDALLLVQEGDLGNAPAGSDLLGYSIVGVGMGRDRSQVRQAEHLTLVGDLPHLFADGVGGFAGEIV